MAEDYSYEYLEMSNRDEYNYYANKQRKIMEKYLAPICDKRHILHSIYD